MGCSRHRRLIGAVALTLAIGALSAAEDPPERVAVLADLSGDVWVHAGGDAGRTRAELGQRLAEGQTVETGPEARARVFLPGGQIITVLGDSRIVIDRDLGGAQADARTPRLSPRSRQMLRKGVWLMSDPDGPVALPGMRGDGRGAPVPRAVPLSPRGERVVAERPRFLWTGDETTVRVVVARDREVLWRGEPVEHAPVSYPEGAPPLRPGASFRWWLEAPADPVPLSAPVTFETLPRGESRDVAAFEHEMERLSDGGDAPLAAFLRCAFYQELGSWSRALALALQLPEGPAADRAVAHSLRQMDLGAAHAVALLDLLPAPDVAKP